MGLNLSSLQIAGELKLNRSDAQYNVKQFRQRILSDQSPLELEGWVEYDEVYRVAGHKGNPDAVNKGRIGRRRSLNSAPGRGTLRKGHSPDFGMTHLSRSEFLRMLKNVKQKSVEPLIKGMIAAGSLVFTDEYDISDLLTQLGHSHRTVCNSKGDYARYETATLFTK